MRAKTKTLDQIVARIRRAIAKCPSLLCVPAIRGW